MTNIIQHLEELINLAERDRNVSNAEISGLHRKVENNQYFNGCHDAFNKAIAIVKAGRDKVEQWKKECQERLDNEDLTEKNLENVQGFIWAYGFVLDEIIGSDKK